MRGSPCLGTSDVGGHESLMPGAGATDGRRQARVGSGKALLRRLFFSAAAGEGREDKREAPGPSRGDVGAACWDRQSLRVL